MLDTGVFVTQANWAQLVLTGILTASPSKLNKNCTSLACVKIASSLFLWHQWQPAPSHLNHCKLTSGVLGIEIMFSFTGSGGQRCQRSSSQENWRKSTCQTILTQRWHAWWHSDGFGSRWHICNHEITKGSNVSWSINPELTGSKNDLNDLKKWKEEM